MRTTFSSPKKAGTRPALDLLGVFEHAMQVAERAEFELSREGDLPASEQRKASGSYYTPADVACHFWDLFFRHHRISDTNSLVAFASSHEFVEPAVGSGMFMWGFFRKAVSIGATLDILTLFRFHLVDINLSALRFVTDQVKEVEACTGVRFASIGVDQIDFLSWARIAKCKNVVFVGNPPFVSNPRGSKWRNLFADFLSAMLEFPAVKGISLVLPLSICFSRDYSKLREMIRDSGFGTSISSYDNIPDCLFKAGKPDSTNTNRANSQRCSILMMGRRSQEISEATPLISWTKRKRESVLSSIPVYRSIQTWRGGEQFPRLQSDRIVRYLMLAKDHPKLQTLLTRSGTASFEVSSVARNYIGIREPSSSRLGSIPILVVSDDARWIVFQVLSSSLFYEYWRTFGDGFHVTREIIGRFPLYEGLTSVLRDNRLYAETVWKQRARYMKTKLNAGREVRSYDFRSASVDTTLSFI